MDRSVEKDQLRDRLSQIISMVLRLQENFVWKVNKTVFLWPSYMFLSDFQQFTIYVCEYSNSSILSSVLCLLCYYSNLFAVIVFHHNGSYFSINFPLISSVFNKFSRYLYLKSGKSQHSKGNTS